MEEVVTVDGVQYLLSYDNPLTKDQRSYAMDNIRNTLTENFENFGTKNTLDNNILGRATVSYAPILNLSPSCPGGSKAKGATITLNAGPTGGIAPYTVTFYKKINTGAQTQITQVTGVPEGGPIASPPTYTVLASDVTDATGDAGASPVLAANKIRIITTASDSCPAGSGGPATSTEICDISLACSTVTCNANIS